ncbi:MAG: DNA repair protein RadC [Atopostipes suicloacalis]|nr:DNA repair protein RadC [Atopostipes suicloacalis]
MYQSNIEEIPNNSRPRERLEDFGVKSLADHELLAILLRTGTKGNNVIGLAIEVLNTVEDIHRLRHVSLQELMKIQGIGRVKAAEILAAVEFGRRVNQSTQLKEGTVSSSSWVGQYLQEELSHLKQENVLALYLNTKNEIIKKDIVFIGSLNSSVAHPREIFNRAISYSAARIILAHNHPSGNVEPSEADLSFTRRMIEAGDLIGIEVLDHFIIGENCYLSLREEGYIG